VNTHNIPEILSQPNELLSLEDLEKVFIIVEKATGTSVPIQSEEPIGHFQQFAKRLAKHKNKLGWTAAFLLVLLGIVALSRKLIPDEIFFPLALGLAVMAEVLGIGIVLVEILVELPFFNRLRKKPFFSLLNMLRAAVTVDLPFLQELTQCNKHAVQYVLKYYQLQRLGLEKRGAVLSGSIDKIGLFPAIAAVLLLWSSLSTSPYSTWSSILVPIIMCFHLLNLWSFGLQQRMDRVIALLEVSVAQRKT
jgi:hypothetical protein